MPYVDGSFPSGSPILTSAGGTTYKCNSFQIARSGETVDVVDENGVYSGALSFVGSNVITAEIQFANSGVAEPTTAAASTNNGTFVNVNIAGSPKTIFVTECSVSKPQRGPWTASITAREKVN